MEIEDHYDTGIEDVDFNEDKYVVQGVRKHLRDNETINKEQLKEIDSKIDDVELLTITHLPPDWENQ
ncbi:MAG: hypothetical protein EOP45_18170 [Sphingobacteriaceae bacterium]|nr:MAG: hypothetical protein EOP45_18170 [Sphingobacteriaceae bacterium]